MSARPSRHFRLPLHIHIVTLFFLLVLLAGGSIAWLSYQRSATMLERAATDLMGRVAMQTLSETERLLQPVGTAVRLTALQRLARAGSLAERMDSLPFLRSALSSAEAMSSIYAGYPDGDFFLLFRIVDQEARQKLGSPAAAAWLVQSIEHRPRGGADAHFLHLDGELRVLLDEPRPDFAASFDPRQRSWYRQAAASGELIYTTPYLFATTGKAGVTAARRSGENAAVVGADIRLASLSATLAHQRLTPASRLVLLDADRRVVAASEPGWLHADRADAAPERLRIDDLGGALGALGAHFPDLRGKGPREVPMAVFQAEGRDWHGVILTLPISGGPPARLGIVVPDDELLTDARAVRDEALLATLAVLLLALPMTYLAARLVSRPLRELVGETAAIRRFDFEGEVATHSVVREVDDLAADLASMKSAIRHFLGISATLAREADFKRLLPRLVEETLAVVGARAGALYLMRDDDSALELAALRGAEGKSLNAELAPPAEVLTDLLAPGASSACGILGDGDVALACRPLFAALGVAEMCFLAVPLQGRDGATVGVLVLLFEEMPAADLVHFVEALSGSAAVAVETRALIRAQKQLFEAFIQLIAGAIDAKSPYTGGHCARVPELTRMLAEAACAATTGPFKDFQLSPDDWEAVHVASWLHDCGKVTTPEYVVDKATKLETLYDRIHEVRMRFEVLKRDAEIAHWKSLADGGAEANLRAQLEMELEQAWARLDEDFAFVAACNEGGEAISAAQLERLREIAGRRWLRTLDDRIGISVEEARRKATCPAPTLPVLEPLLADRPEHCIERSERDAIAPDNPWGFRLKVPALLYNRGELANLSVGRGTLTDEDRYKINEHIVETIRMLAELPFPRHLRAVPEIAGAHHERMDGLGYPRGLRREEMSPVARMMAIADIFEALTAVDRPYKKGKSLSEALGIMARMRDEGHIDPDLFALFLESGVYRDYATRFMQPAAIDPVDLAAILSR